MTAAELVSGTEATVALNAVVERACKAILVGTTPPYQSHNQGQESHSLNEDFLFFYLSCILSRMGTIISNFGLLAGSSFMQIFMSLQMCGEMPGGIVGLKPSKAT